MTARPKLSHETMAEYLDWTVNNWTSMNPRPGQGRADRGRTADPHQRQ